MGLKQIKEAKAKSDLMGQEIRKTPTECRVRAVFLNLDNQVGTPKALKASLPKGLHTMLQEGFPLFVCWLKNNCPITNTVGDCCNEKPYPKPG